MFLGGRKSGSEKSGRLSKVTQQMDDSGAHPGTTPRYRPQGHGGSWEPPGSALGRGELPDRVRDLGHLLLTPVQSQPERLETVPPSKRISLSLTHTHTHTHTYTRHCFKSQLRWILSELRVRRPRSPSGGYQVPERERNTRLWGRPLQGRLSQKTCPGTGSSAPLPRRCPPAPIHPGHPPAPAHGITPPLPSRDARGRRLT